MPRSPVDRAGTGVALGGGMRFRWAPGLALVTLLSSVTGCGTASGPPGSCTEPEIPAPEDEVDPQGMRRFVSEGELDGYLGAIEARQADYQAKVQARAAK